MCASKKLSELALVDATDRTCAEFLGGCYGQPFCRCEAAAPSLVSRADVLVLAPDGSPLISRTQPSPLAVEIDCEKHVVTLRGTRSDHLHVSVKNWELD